MLRFCAVSMCVGGCRRRDRPSERVGALSGFTAPPQAVDTIMLSFCDDCERHGGDPKFAPPQLQARRGAHREACEVCGAFSAPLTLPARLLRAGWPDRMGRWR